MERLQLKELSKNVAAYDGKTIIVNGRSTKILDDEKAVGEPGVHFKLTREDADAFAALLDSIERRVDDNTPAAAVFWNEYWSDPEKPFDEFLKFIQSKMSIYLCEQQDW